MSKALKISLIALAVLVGTCVVSAVLLPSEWQVERSVTIAAPASAIHPLVDDFHQWREWANPRERDPSVKYAYDGPERGVGAEQSWIGDRSRGRMKITKSDPAKGVWMQSAVLSSEYNGEAAITFEPGEGGTVVTWSGHGDLMPVVGGLLARRIGQGVGDYYEHSLGELKKLAEGGAAAAQEPEAAGAEADAGADPEGAPDPGETAEE
jgi:hypothetical protein